MLKRTANSHLLAELGGFEPNLAVHKRPEDPGAREPSQHQNTDVLTGIPAHRDSNQTKRLIARAYLDNPEEQQDTPSHDDHRVGD